MRQRNHIYSATKLSLSRSSRSEISNLLKLSYKFLFTSLTDAADPPCIVRVNIFVRSISRIDDVTMVSDCNGKVLSTNYY